MAPETWNAALPNARPTIRLRFTSGETLIFIGDGGELATIDYGAGDVTTFNLLGAMRTDDDRATVLHVQNASGGRAGVWLYDDTPEANAVILEIVL